MAGSTQRKAGAWIQRLGLRWAPRLAQDRRSLWNRYLGLNSLYLSLLALQLTRAWRPRTDGVARREMLRCD
jgi:UDP-N-acetyl-D-mannosaminuronic acid transferase (WecB/TagA/CpsF family)